ncbi:unnamed protein product [Dicrocoelium dendriticum]|nr:unnamed protein product [Dicrocoelium dendriticum]
MEYRNSSLRLHGLLMSTSNERVERLITRYFNQLTRGCQDPQCPNPNCASSARFSHSGISANQAAALALQLTSRQAPLCYPSDSAVDLATDSMDTDDGLGTDHDSEFPHSNTRSTMSEQITVGTSNSTAIGESLSNLLEASELSRGSFMRPNEITRLLMLLFDVSDTDEATPVRQPENQSSGDTNVGNSPQLLPLDNSRTEVTSSAGSGTRSTSSTFTSCLSASDEANGNAETLKNLWTSSNTNSTLASLVSSLHANQERESRTSGLTISELRDSISMGKSQGDWSHLIGLLSAVFSSYEALSASFVNETMDYECVVGQSDPLAKRGRSSEGHTSCSIEDTGKTSDCPMEEDPHFSEQTADVPVGHLPALISTSKDTIDADAHLTPLIHPVNIHDIRCAWSMISALPERQNVVDALMRAVRRLVVTSLHQILVSKVPNSLGDPDAPFSVKNTQQRLINLFLILYECPFATDPLHFEHLLLNINRAATWLPVMLQARLCRAWAKSAHLPLPDCLDGTPPSPEQTNLWSLQKILLHHITLRCLTTDHGVPNEDKQICEAALVLRIVYYASLLAGELDSEELLKREAKENAEFEELMHNYFIIEHRSERSRPHSIEDPLAKALAISPHDCRKPFIPAKDFVNETLNEGLKPKRDYVNYRSNDTFGELSFMKLPFLLQTSSKTVLLYYDNRMRMLDEQRGAFLQSLFVENPELPFLKLHISRDRVIEDALLALEITCLEKPSDLRKQLMIEFEDEQGVDEGGLSKEFFQLIIEKVFDPVYGMFTCDDELGTYWFNPVPLEDLDREYCLIGILLGLAIYNDIILDVHFPSVLYRKLAGKLGTFEDLKDARPDLMPGLTALLEYDDDDFEEAFDCNFVVSYSDPFGNTQHHELIPNGSSIPVTKANRQEFAERYADFLLNESVKKQFRAFRRGFQMVVSESPLNFLFRPDEIELLIRGSREYDFRELERVTSYEDYTADSPVIKNFWHVVHNMTSEQQRQLLQFSTGSDRIPVGGMSKMKFIIARQGADPHRLPTAHTCFNILLLPDYPTLDQLKREVALSAILKGVLYLSAFTALGHKTVSESPMATHQPPGTTSDDLSCLDVVRFATARAAELAAFESSVNVITLRAVTGLQRLPVRLRRRAASHRINRLPRRLHRHHHSNQTAGQSSEKLPTQHAKLKQSKAKRVVLKSRRFRRRHLRLLDFATRLAASASSDVASSDGTCKSLWLPTHLWHAKRFHMIDIWGWRLPHKPNDKIFKACQNAALSGCLVFDMSFLNCLELVGPETILAACINSFTRCTAFSSSCKAPTNEAGAPAHACEQLALMYTDFNVISDPSVTVCLSRPVLGPVRLLWGPVNQPESYHRRVYLWIHPAMSKEAIDLVQRCTQHFNVSPSNLGAIRFANLTGRVTRICTIGRQSHRLLSDIFTPSDSVHSRGDWKAWATIAANASQSSCLPCGLTLYLPQCTDFLQNRPKLKLRNRNWIWQPPNTTNVDLSRGGERYTWSDSLFTTTGNFADLLCDGAIDESSATQTAPRLFKTRY